MAVLIYNLLLSLVILIAGLVNADSFGQVLLSLLALPVIVYLIRRLIYQARFLTHSTFPANHLPRSLDSGQVVVGDELPPMAVDDVNRRLFLKLIGSSGLATLVFALFRRDAQAAFFGSIPGPGTVALKNTAGIKIDPAEKGPTDGYEITDVDDSSFPAYYGFVNKDGAWYIAREGATGEYRYFRGSDNYASNWINHESLAYSLFNNVF